MIAKNHFCQALKRITIEREIPASVSAGVVISDMKGGMDEVFKQADMALYRAKAENKGGSYVMEK